MTTRFSPSGNFLVTASLDHTARVWSAINGETLMVLSGHEDRVINAEFLDDDTIVTGSCDQTARVWDRRGVRSTVRLGAPVVNELIEAPIVLHAPGRARVFTVSRHRSSAELWDATTGELLRSFPWTHLASAKFSLDGERLLISDGNRAVTIWNAESAELVANLTAHDGTVLDAAFGADGNSVVTASEQRGARRWSLARSQLIATVPNRDLEAIQFSADGSQLLAAGAHVESLVPENGDLRVRLETVGNARFGRSGTIVFARRGSTFATFNVSSGALQRTFSELSGAADISPTGSLIFSARHATNAARSSIITLTDAESGSLIARQSITGHVSLVLFAPRGELAVAAIDYVGISAWRSSDGRRLWATSLTESPIDIAFSPRGEALAVTTYSSVFILNASTGAVRQRIDLDHPGARAAFSPDGRNLVAATNNSLTGEYQAHIWRVADGEPTITLRGHTNEIRSVEFSSDGRFVVTGSADGSGRLWSVADGRMLQEFRPPANYGGAQATISPDSRRLALALSHAVQLWDVSRLLQPPDEIVAYICSDVLGGSSRRFTPMEIESDSLLRSQWPVAERDVCMS